MPLTPPSLLGKQLVVVAVAMLVSISYGWRAAASVGLGGGLQVVNLRALQQLVAGVLGLAIDGKRWVALLLPLRLALLLGLVAIVLFTLPVQPLFFAAGLATSVVAVLWHGVTTVPAVRPDPGAPRSAR